MFAAMKDPAASVAAVTPFPASLVPLRGQHGASTATDTRGALGSLSAATAAWNCWMNGTVDGVLGVSMTTLRDQMDECESATGSFPTIAASTKLGCALMRSSASTDSEA